MSLASTMTTLVLFGFCATVASARTILNFSPDGNLEDIEVGLQNDVENLDYLQSVLEEFGEENVECLCNGLTCQCCQQVKIKKFKVKYYMPSVTGTKTYGLTSNFQLKICMKLTYEPSAGAIAAELKFNEQSIWKYEFPLGHIPTPCIGWWGFKVCVTFQDVRLDNKVLSGCVQLALKGFGDFKINLGCFHIKLGNSVAEPKSSFLSLVRAMKMK